VQQQLDCIWYAHSNWQAEAGQLVPKAGPCHAVFLLSVQRPLHSTQLNIIDAGIGMRILQGKYQTREDPNRIHSRLQIQ
jgi:hypothetical protein